MKITGLYLPYIDIVRQELITQVLSFEVQPYLELNYEATQQ